MLLPDFGISEIVLILGVVLIIFGPGILIKWGEIIAQRVHNWGICLGKKRN